MRRIFRCSVAALTSLALGAHVPLSPVGAAAMESRRFAPAENDEVARRCDVLAAPRSDRLYSGPREPITPANRAEALSVCQQAASVRPVRPRYTYQLGVVLWNAQRYDEAVRQFAAARDAGNAWGAMGLGLAYADGVTVAQDGAAALRLYREAHAAGVPTDAHIGWLYESGIWVPADGVG